MQKFLIIVLFPLIASSQAMSQILPKENSKLNYRIIGFSFPTAPDVNKYKIEIANGNYYSVDSFNKNIIYTSYSKSKKIIAEVPSFGKQYTWRVVCKDKGTSSPNNELHHFSTLIIPAIDTGVTHLRVIQDAKTYKDAYVFLDGNRALYDMKGNAVWYLPDIDGYNTDLSRLRDMKLTTRGTITFMYEERAAYEINYNGDILWKAPDNGIVQGAQFKPATPGNKFTKPGTNKFKAPLSKNNVTNSDLFHHEFTRLANGHYMILGVENELWNQKLPSSTDSSFMIFPGDGIKQDSSSARYITMPFGDIIEYDAESNVVWSWKSSDYFRRSDIYYHNEHGKPEIAAHENSFYFDEKSGIIYVGFRNISRILKVKYPEGTVLNSYGEEYKPNVPEAGNGLFCRQHSVRRSEDGYLYLYNNNSCKHGELPTIIKLKEPVSANGQLEKIWEYKCTIDGLVPDQQNSSYQFPVGGNVLELPDRSLFINMSTTYSKVFILGTNEKISWSAIPEKWNPVTKKWEMIYQYRANIITTRKELENLVWSSEITK